MKKIAFLCMCLLLAGALWAQNLQVSGVVTDASDGQPLPGAAVRVEGTNTVALTDINGRYTITAPSNGTLVISFTGMTTVEVDVEGRNLINVLLELDSVQLDEVLVVAYGTARKSSFTGSATVVNAEAFKNSRVESVDKALAGKTSGVRVASISGDPGAGADLQIRGIGSISGTTDPLYVVDGIPIISGNYNSRAQTNILSAINPSDIESMTVLEDAAAASLYGSRAANGVVIITTKKGKDGKARINFQANYGLSNMATNSYEVMSGIAYYDYFKTTIENTVADGRSANIPSYGYFLGPDDYLQAGWELERTNGEDWRKFIYGTGVDQNYQISVSGANDKTNYYVSASYQDVKGMVTSTGFQRYAGTLNLTSDVSKWLSMEGKAQLSYATQQGIRDSYTGNATGGGIGSFSPSGLLFQSDPTKFAYNPDGSVNEEVSLSGTFYSPIYELGSENKFLNTDNARALVNYNIELRFTDYLKFRSVNGVDFMDVLITEYWGPLSGDGRSVSGMGQKDNYRNITLTSSNILSFNKTFGKAHNLELLGGYEVQKYTQDYTQAAVSNYSTTKLPALSVGIASRALGTNSSWFMNSWLFNTNYNFDQRYYLGANIRTDQSSRLGTDNRSGIFYSVSGAWRFARESFLAGNPVLTDAKIRASYGTNGNLPGSYYGHMGLYSFTGKYGANSAIYPTQPANPDLGWEKSSNINAGLDFTLFNRFNFSVEYFYKYTTDLLMDVPTSITTGFTSALQNKGEISNKGIDFEFHGKDMLKSSVRWDADFSLSTLKATVEKLPDGNPLNLGFIDNMYRYEEGKDLYSFYMPTWLGVDPATGMGQFLADPTQPATANNIVNTQNAAERSIVAKAYPTVAGGLVNTFSYQGVSLSFLLTYQFGGNLYDYAGYFLHADGRRLTSGWNAAADIIGNYWTTPGDVVDNPRPTIYSQSSDLMSSRWIHSSDFIRLKELSLAYSFPKDWINPIGLSNLSVNLTINNLTFLYAATKHLDPETPLNGFKTVDTPLPRIFTFGLNLTL